jgi:hypothetical protein
MLKKTGHVRPITVLNFIKYFKVKRRMSKITAFDELVEAYNYEIKTGFLLQNVGFEQWIKSISRIELVGKVFDKDGILVNEILIPINNY